MCLVVAFLFLASDPEVFLFWVYYSNYVISARNQLQINLQIKYELVSTGNNLESIKGHFIW